MRFKGDQTDQGRPELCIGWGPEGHLHRLCPLKQSETLLRRHEGRCWLCRRNQALWKKGDAPVTEDIAMRDHFLAPEQFFNILFKSVS